jgi:CheY-like chemotaxis protein
MTVQNAQHRLLLVEDNVNDLTLTLDALGQGTATLTVDVVRDGQEALDYMFRCGAFAARPDVQPLAILLDLKLPRVDGLEVLAVLKKDRLTRMVPIIILTASREEPDLQRAYSLGVNAYVVKPLEFDAFVAALRHFGMFWCNINVPAPAAANKLGGLPDG